MSRHNLFWGFFLIAVGGLFLADNLGYIQFQIGLLWPIFLVFLGVYILIGRNFAPSWNSSAEKMAVPLDGAKEAHIRIEHGAGRLHISGKAGAQELLSGKFDHVDLSSKRSGDDLKVSLKSRWGENMMWAFPWNWGSYRHEWDFALNGDVPISLDIDSGASESHLDLRELKIKKIDLDTGASSNVMILPEKAGFTKVDISSGAASHEVTVPAGVAADIRIESGLSGIDIDEKRFPRAGKHYTSPDYATAANKVEINVETGVSSVTIK
jgi:hypothetical protein